jgi:hypothetical protein
VSRLQAKASYPHSQASNNQRRADYNRSVDRKEIRYQHAIDITNQPVASFSIHFSLNHMEQRAFFVRLGSTNAIPPAAISIAW